MAEKRRTLCEEEDDAQSVAGILGTDPGMVRLLLTLRTTVMFRQVRSTEKNPSSRNLLATLGKMPPMFSLPGSYRFDKVHCESESPTGFRPIQQSLGIQWQPGSVIGIKGDMGDCS